MASDSFFKWAIDKNREYDTSFNWVGTEVEKKRRQALLVADYTKKQDAVPTYQFRDSWEKAISLASYTYRNAKDPTADVSRNVFGQVLGQSIGISPKLAEQIYRPFMKQATGKDMDATGWLTQFGNTFASALVGQQAGLNTFGYYLDIATHSYTEEQKKERYDSLIKSNAKLKATYRTDYMHNNVFKKILNNTAEALPSILQSLVVYAALGGVAPALATGVNFLWTSMAETGGTLLELLQMENANGQRIDEKTAMWTALIGGIASGTIEVAFDGFTRNTAKALRSFFGIAKKIDFSKVAIRTARDYLASLALDNIKEGAGEVVQEVMQDYISMLAQNVIMENDPNGGFDKYDAEEITRALINTAVKTGSSQLLLGGLKFGGTAIGSKAFKSGTLYKIDKAGKVSSWNEGAVLLGTKEIDSYGTAKKPAEGESLPQISVFKVGDRILPTAESADAFAYAKQNSDYVYARIADKTTVSGKSLGFTTLMALSHELKTELSTDALVAPETEAVEIIKKIAEGRISLGKSKSTIHLAGLETFLDGKSNGTRLEGEDSSSPFFDKAVLSLMVDGEQRTVTINTSSESAFSNDSSEAVALSEAEQAKAYGDKLKEYTTAQTASFSRSLEDTEGHNARYMTKVNRAYQLLKEKTSGNITSDAELMSASYIVGAISDATGQTVEQVNGRYSIRFVADDVMQTTLSKAEKDTARGGVKKGDIEVTNLNDKDKSFTISLSDKRTESTLAHEVGHMLRMLSTPRQLKGFAKAYGGTEGAMWLEDINISSDGHGKTVYVLGKSTFETWEEASKAASAYEERFTNDLLKYLATGKTLNSDMKSFFDRLIRFVKDLYSGLKGSLSKETVKAFDSLFSRIQKADEAMAAKDESRRTVASESAEAPSVPVASSDSQEGQDARLNDIANAADSMDNEDSAEEVKHESKEESGTHPRAIQGFVSDSRGAKDTGGLLRHNNEGEGGVTGGSEEGRAYASGVAEIHPEDGGGPEGEEVRLGGRVRGLLRYRERRHGLLREVVEGIRKSGIGHAKKTEGTVFYQLDKSTPEARLASARLFHDALSAAKAASEHGEAVSLYNVETTTDDYGNVSVGYADDSVDLYLSEDLHSGYAIHRPANPNDKSRDAGNGTVTGNDLISVFSNSKASGKRYTIYSILLDAIFNGADKLDCYGKELAEKYARMGFVPASKIKFNEAYATDAWKANYDTYGKPDIFIMYYNDDDVEATARLLRDRIRKNGGLDFEKLIPSEYYKAPAGGDSYSLAMDDRDIMLMERDEEREKQREQDREIKARIAEREKELAEKAKAEQLQLKGYAKETQDAVSLYVPDGGILDADKSQDPSRLELANALDEIRKFNKDERQEPYQSIRLSSKMPFIIAEALRDTVAKGATRISRKEMDGIIEKGLSINKLALKEKILGAKHEVSINDAMKIFASIFDPVAVIHDTVHGDNDSRYYIITDYMHVEKTDAWEIKFPYIVLIDLKSFDDMSKTSTHPEIFNAYFAENAYAVIEAGWLSYVNESKIKMNAIFGKTKSSNPLPLGYKLGWNSSSRILKKDELVNNVKRQQEAASARLNDMTDAIAENSLDDVERITELGGLVSDSAISRFQDRSAAIKKEGLYRLIYRRDRTLADAIRKVDEKEPIAESNFESAANEVKKILESQKYMIPSFIGNGFSQLVLRIGQYLHMRVDEGDADQSLLDSIASETEGSSERIKTIASRLKESGYLYDPDKLGTLPLNQLSFLADEIEEGKIARNRIINARREIRNNITDIRRALDAIEGNAHGTKDYVSTGSINLEEEEHYEDNLSSQDIIDMFPDDMRNRIRKGAYTSSIIKDLKERLDSLVKKNGAVTESLQELKQKKKALDERLKQMAITQKEYESSIKSINEKLEQLSVKYQKQLAENLYMKGIGKLKAAAKKSAGVDVEITRMLSSIMRQITRPSTAFVDDGKHYFKYPSIPDYADRQFLIIYDILSSAGIIEDGWVVTNLKGIEVSYIDAIAKAFDDARGLGRKERVATMNEAASRQASSSSYVLEGMNSSTLSREQKKTLNRLVEDFIDNNPGASETEIESFRNEARLGLLSNDQAYGKPGSIGYETERNKKGDYKAKYRNSWLNLTTNTMYNILNGISSRLAHRIFDGIPTTYLKDSKGNYVLDSNGERKIAYMKAKGLNQAYDEETVEVKRRQGGLVEVVTEVYNDTHYEGKKVLKALKSSDVQALMVEKTTRIGKLDIDSSDYKSISAGIRDRIEALSDMQKAIAEKHSGHSLSEEDDITSERERIGNPYDYTANAMVAAYVLMQQEEGIMKLSGVDTGSISLGNNLSIEELAWIAFQMERNEEWKPYKKIADYILSEAGSKWDSISNIYRRINNKSMEKIDNYFTLVLLDADQRDALSVDIDEDLKKGIDSPEHGFTIDRTGGVQALNLNILSTFNRLIERQEHYIAFAEMMNDIKHEMYDQGVKNQIEAIAGKRTAEYIIKWLGNISNASSVSMLMTGWMAKLRGNMTLSALSYNITPIIKQLCVLPYIMSQHIGLGTYMKAVTEYMSDRKGFEESIFKKSPQMMNTSRMETETTRHVIEENFSQYGKFKQGMAQIAEYGLQGMEKVDRFMKLTMWRCAYDKFMNDAVKNGKDIGDESVQAEASSYATNWINNTQTSTRAKDNPMIMQTDQEALKSLMMFMGQSVKQFDMLVNDGFLEGVLKNDIRRFVDVIFSVAMSMALTAFIGGTALPADDDDKWWQTMSDGMLLELLGNIPIVGKELANAEKGYGGGESYFEFLNSVFAAGRAIKDPEKAIEDKLTSLARAVLNTSGTLFGAPSNQITKVVNAIDKSNPGYLLNKGWGEYDWNFMEHFGD